MVQYGIRTLLNSWNEDIENVLVRALYHRSGCSGATCCIVEYKVLLAAKIGISPGGLSSLLDTHLDL